MDTVFYVSNAETVKVINNHVNPWYRVEHVNRRKHWYSNEREIYDCVTDMFGDEFDCETYLNEHPHVKFSENGDVLYKPYVSIKYDRTNYRFYFETKEEAESFKKHITRPEVVNFSYEEVSKIFNIIKVE